MIMESEISIVLWFCLLLSLLPLCIYCPFLDRKSQRPKRPLDFFTYGDTVHSMSGITAVVAFLLDCDVTALTNKVSQTVSQSVAESHRK